MVFSKSPDYDEPLEFSNHKFESSKISSYHHNISIVESCRTICVSLLKTIQRKHLKIRKMSKGRVLLGEKNAWEKSKAADEA